ncbi:helix-turn-helix transcriptional regulator [Streptomyces sp. NBC_00989]|uniref:PadR family transcriptional regulator n=1 Tax=Streptomyces sp. NBC_00989 TaxID=2903705 RepID=UPI002F91AF29|nr:PadR family transcriptional regulator [Streptomyces sp. NBC_00989]
MTLQTQLVMRELLQNPTRAQYGLEVGSTVGLPSGTIHPILARLERAGIVESFWEAADEHAQAEPSRPRRRYYKFTEDGAETARLALAAAYKGGQASARMTGKPIADS